MPPWFSDFEDPTEESPPSSVFSEDHVGTGERLSADEVDLLEVPERDQEDHAGPAERLSTDEVDLLKVPGRDSERSSIISQQRTPLTSCSSSICRSTSSSVVPNAAASVTQQLSNQRLEIRLPKSTLATPRGRYDGWTPPAPRATQYKALALLTEYLESQKISVAEEDFIEFELDNFSIYVESVIYPCELRPLQHLSTKGPDQFFFDGVLGIGKLKFYVERVAFGELPIGNYGTSHDSVDDQIWIRSRVNAGKEIYYKLKTPATEYERFHTPFLWIADLAKHVIDFCEHMTGKNKSVTLRHFQQDFSEWLQKTHKKSPIFRSWHKLHGSNDFRTAINANVDFIWKEVYGVLGQKVARSLQVFKEVKHLTAYRPFAAILGDKRSPVQPPTIVTPYVHACFGHSEFGHLLESLQPKEKSNLNHENEPDFQTAEEVQKVEVAVVQDILASDLQRRRRKSSERKNSSVSAARRTLINNIKVGDTISTPPDGAETGTRWKKEVAKGSTDEHRWFGLVQRVHISERTRERTFDVTWLYRPVDTPCCKMVYPWSKELFLSDHCTCEEGRDARVGEDEILAVHDIDWFGSPETTTKEFFVRQTYQVEQRRWVTLERSHMTCAHDKQGRLEYKPGDTVLATVSMKEDRADVYEVVKVFKQGGNRFARLRRLIRRTDLEPSKNRNVRANELVYTDQTVVMRPQRILGKCLVRFFDSAEPLPCPYNRNGTGNVFFITHKLQGGVCVPLAEDNRPKTMRQGFDPNRPVKKLRGLDLFCGSGNFGRGLEEGGVVDMRWTNDIWTEAIHTYMANAPRHTKPFLGSVDDLLRRAIEGDHGVPRRGDVDFISGGSPCQGFSLITADKAADRQKKNRSLVASFASFVDFYRPKYGILENVLSIVQAGHNRDEDAFSQLICAIVGMGYQTQLTLGDAWTHGAPQSRSRAFLYFAAPGYRLPDPPRPSHSHFSDVKGRSLGLMTNGERFVSRSFEPTPFKYVSAAEATADIPQIQDAKPDFCIGFPDHRLSLGVSTKALLQIKKIPVRPYGMNFAKAWNGGDGVMTAAERELFPPKGSRVQPNSRGWTRIRPHDVFRTITTDCNPTDARTGRFLHWYEDRPITILEVRRAQGFLDHEVLIGRPASQYELVGNSVARPVALALGLQFRDAWLGGLYDDQLPIASKKEVDEIDAGLAKIPMTCGEDEDSQEQDRGMDWDDDWDSPDPLAEGIGIGNTPVTSTPGRKTKVLSAGSGKRPLPNQFSVDSHVSKLRRVQVEHVNQEYDANGQASLNGDGIQPMTNGVTVVRSYAAAVVFRGRDELALTPGASDGGTTPTLPNESSVVQSVIDLTAAPSEPEAGVQGIVVQSSTAMMIDLTND